MKEKWEYKEIEIGDVQFLLDEYEIEVSSPDGWVVVNDFVDKGPWQEHKLIMLDGSDRIILCNENHKFKLFDGKWYFAKDLVYREFMIETDTGPQWAKLEKTSRQIPIVDIQVNHINHRYYTDGVESHNTNTGKSMLLCDWAADWLKAGYNGLYITAEMSEERVAERIDANLLGVPIIELKSLSKEYFAGQVAQIQRKTQGRLIIKEYPTRSASVRHIRKLLHDLETKQSFKPDFIMVDYLNIFASASIKADAGMYSYIKAVAEELRGLAMETNTVVVAPTQTNRCLSENTIVNTKHASNISIKDVSIGDYILGENNQYKLVTDKFSSKELCYKITTKSGKEIVCSAKHIFPTQSNERSLETGLVVGDYLYTT